MVTQSDDGLVVFHTDHVGGGAWQVSSCMQLLLNVDAPLPGLLACAPPVLVCKVICNRAGGGAGRVPYVEIDLRRSSISMNSKKHDSAFTGSQFGQREFMASLMLALPQLLHKKESTATTLQVVRAIIFSK